MQIHTQWQMISFLSDKWHTPMCNSKCTIEHHHLVLTLCGHSNRTNYRKNRFHQSQYTRSNFAHCIRKNLIEGFNKNTDVLDGLEKLQLPLVHLAGIFFKYCAIETLSYFGFDLNVLSQKTGDFPLHSVLRHNYEGMKVYKGTTFMNTTYGEKVFTKVLNSLTNGLNAVEVLSQQDRNGDTPFLVAAKCVIDTSVHDTMQQVITASEIPDSTQECSGSNSQMGKSLNNSSGVCNAMKANKQQHRADFHMGCIGVMIQKLHESSIVNHKVDLTLAKKVLMVKNNCGETFLQVLCKEHHIAAACISKVLSKFPLGILIDCAKECIPESCWPDCIRSERRSVKQREIANLAYTSGAVNSALETTPTSKRKGGTVLLSCFCILAGENSWHVVTPLLVFQRNDVWETSAESHTDNACTRSGYCFWLAENLLQPIRNTNHLGSDVLLVQNFCNCF